MMLFFATLLRFIDAFSLFSPCHFAAAAFLRHCFHVATAMRLILLLCQYFLRCFVTLL